MSLLATRMQNLRSGSNIDKNEYRPSRYGALDLYVSQTGKAGSIITPELVALAQQSIGRTLETPVIDYDGTISIGNTRSVTIADSENNSKMVQFTFQTYAFGFTQVPTLFLNNEIGAQRDFDTKMQKYLYKLAKTLDIAAIAELSANKTQVLKDALDYSVTGNVIKATKAQGDLVIGDLNPMMYANDFFNPIHIVGNAGIEAKIRHLAEHGLYNDENKQLEYNDKVLHFTSEIPNDTNAYGTGYAVEDGNVGLLFRFERECIAGRKTADGHEWSKDMLPILNIPCGTYYYESVGNYSGIAGAASADMDRVFKQHFGFAIDICFVTAYNSDPTTIASPIIAFDIAK